MSTAFTTTRLAALAALALCSAPVLAYTSYTNADVSQFKIELIDLDPTDGITPNLQINKETWSSASGYSGATSTTDIRKSAGSTQLQQGYGEVGGSTGATGVSSHAGYSYPLPNNTESHSWSDISEHRLQFTLTPSTGLILSAYGSIDLYQLGGGNTGASLALGAKWRDLDGNFLDGRFDERGESASTLSAWSNASANAPLTAFLYTDQYTRSGEIYLTAQTSMWVPTVAPSVPEPTTYAMLLAGAALLGAQRLRKR